MVYFGTVTGPITISSTSVGRAAWLTNARRYRFRVSSGKGDLPVTIAKGRLAEEGIMLVPNARISVYPGAIQVPDYPGELAYEYNTIQHQTRRQLQCTIPGKFRGILKKRDTLILADETRRIRRANLLFYSLVCSCHRLHQMLPGTSPCPVFRPVHPGQGQVP